jgi:MarR family transcriptional regulator for hemolysin
MDKNIYILIVCILMIRELTIMRTYDYEKSIGFLVNKTARAYQRAFDQELRANVGLTISQWRIIFTLIRQSGLTQREIADRVGVEAPTLIPIIDKMEKEGLVERKTYQEDRRINRIYLTSKTEDLCDPMIECALRISSVSTKDIPEEQLQIMKDVLGKISDNLMLLNSDCKPVPIAAVTNTTVGTNAEGTMNSRIDGPNARRKGEYNDTIIRK